MKIGFEAKRIFHNASGLGNFGRNLLRALSKYMPDNEYQLYNPKEASIPFAEFLPNVKETRPAIGGAIYRNLWRQRFISDRAKKDGIEIFHGLSQELPMGLAKRGIKSVVSVHDAIFIRYPHLYKSIDRKIYTRKLRTACKRADKIVAISEQTKNDLVEFFHIPAKDIQVIYQGVNPIYWKEFLDEEPQDVRERYGFPEKFALFVGTLEVRKGVDKILDAQLETGIPVVYVGRPTQFWEDLKSSDKYKDIQHLIYTPEIRLDEDLAKVYRIAELFIYPSIFEGFGIPVLEALISKTPVITSNLSSLPEAAGPGSKLVDPESQEEITVALQEVWSNDSLKKEMIKTGYTFAQSFKDEAIAKEWNLVYQSLIS